MTRAQLNAVCKDNSLEVNGMRYGAGKFIDLEIGSGADWGKLSILRNNLIDAGFPANMMDITRVTNPEHPQYRELYLELKSFWNE